MTRRRSGVLMAAAIWTIYVWGARVGNLLGEERTTSFKVVHAGLAAVSIAFAIATGIIGWQCWRMVGRDDG